MEEEDDADFIIEEFLENLDSAEEEDVEVSEDEVAAIEEDAEESEDELYEAGVYMTEEEYQEERFMRLKEENFLLTDELFCMRYKLEVLCRIVNIEKENFEKEWEFFEEILFQEEEDSGKSNPKDIYLAKMYDSLREKFPLNEKKSQENFGCLAIEDLRSAGIIELKKASEGQELKAAHDLEAFGISENKASDDLLLRFVEIDEEWNALIAGSSPTPQKQNWNMSNSAPILHKHPLTTQSLTDIDRDATQDIWQQNEFIHDTPQEIPGDGMFGESDSLFGEHGGERRRLDGEGDNIVSHFHYAQTVDDIDLRTHLPGDHLIKIHSNVQTENFFGQGHDGNYVGMRLFNSPVQSLGSKHGIEDHQFPSNLNVVSLHDWDSYRTNHGDKEKSSSATSHGRLLPQTSEDNSGPYASSEDSIVCDIQQHIDHVSSSTQNIRNELPLDSSPCNARSLNNLEGHFNDSQYHTQPADNFAGSNSVESVLDYGLGGPFTGHHEESTINLLTAQEWTDAYGMGELIKSMVKGVFIEYVKAVISELVEKLRIYTTHHLAILEPWFLLESQLHMQKMYEEHLVIELNDVMERLKEMGPRKVFGEVKNVTSSFEDKEIYCAPVKIGGEDIFESDLMWRRLIRSVLVQSLAALKSSQGFIVL